MTEFNNSKDEKSLNINSLHESSLICVSFIGMYINKMKARKKWRHVKDKDT